MKSEYSVIPQAKESLGTKILPLNLHSVMSRAAYLLSNFKACEKDSLEQIKVFCKGRFVDTQCFVPRKEIVATDENGYFAGYKRVSLVTISSKEDFRLKWHLNYTYNSIFVNWYNLQEIIEHFAPDYPQTIIEYDDVITTVKEHMAWIAPSSKEQVDNLINIFYTARDFEESLELFKNNFKNLDFLKKVMMVSCRCCHNIEDEEKPKIKLHIYRTKWA